MITTPPETFSSFLFDLDGTLADTAPDLVAALNAVVVFPSTRMCTFRGFLGGCFP